MKRNEVLRYPLADIGPESPVMTVRLHRTPSGYWRFDVRYNHQIDIADRLFNSLAEHAGREEKVMSLFNRIPGSESAVRCKRERNSHTDMGNSVLSGESC